MKEQDEEEGAIRRGRSKTKKKEQDEDEGVSRRRVTKTKEQYEYDGARRI